MNKHKSNKIKENSNTVRHLIMGQIITTQNLVATKVVRLAGQSCLVGLVFCSNFRGKNFSFFSEKSNASAFYTSNKMRKLLINNKFKAQTLTGNPTGNYRCEHLASRSSNMSCSFSQSTCSIESRCVVILMKFRSNFKFDYNTFIDISSDIHSRCHDRCTALIYRWLSAILQ